MIGVKFLATGAENAAGNGVVFVRGSFGVDLQSFRISIIRRRRVSDPKLRHRDSFEAASGAVSIEVYRLM